MSTKRWPPVAPSGPGTPETRPCPNECGAQLPYAANVCRRCGQFSYVDSDGTYVIVNHDTEIGPRLTERDYRVLAHIQTRLEPYLNMGSSPDSGIDLRAALRDLIRICRKGS